MSMPVSSLSFSPVRWCEVPTPAEPKFTLPGFALAYWMSSGTFFGGKLRFAARRSGECEITVTEAKSFDGVVLRSGYTCALTGSAAVDISSV